VSRSKRKIDFRKQRLKKIFCKVNKLRPNKGCNTFSNSKANQCAIILVPVTSSWLFSGFLWSCAHVSNCAAKRKTFSKETSKCAFSIQVWAKPKRNLAWHQEVQWPGKENTRKRVWRLQMRRSTTEREMLWVCRDQGFLQTGLGELRMLKNVLVAE